jgi:histidyl-tRNA synthetase
VVDTTGGTAARDFTIELRRAGISAERAFDGRSMKSQMKSADKSGAAFVCIIGDDEAAAGTVTIRDLRGDTGQEAVGRSTAAAVLAARLS